MRLFTRLSLGSVAVLCFSAAACNGAPPAAAEKPAKKTPVQPAASRSKPGEVEAPVGKDAGAAPAKQVAAAAIQPVMADEAPEYIYPPKVTLSDAHKAQATIKVGDAFPTLTLNDLAGKSTDVSKLLGPKLTVVLFWSDKFLYAREQFQRFGPEVAGRYEKLGVKVVAINVGDAPAVVQKAAGELKVTFPCLVDADGKAFAQVAKEGLPRTFVLDAQGKVLWFDQEYSRPMRRELHNAVHYFTQAPKPAVN